MLKAQADARLDTQSPFGNSAIMANLSVSEMHLNLPDCHTGLFLGIKLNNTYGNLLTITAPDRCVIRYA